MSKATTIVLGTVGSAAFLSILVIMMYVFG